MKASELITELQKLGPDTPIYVRGYESGVDDVATLRPIRVKRDFFKGEDYYGSHDEVQYNEHEGPLEHGVTLECGP